MDNGRLERTTLMLADENTNCIEVVNGCMDGWMDSDGGGGGGGGVSPRENLLWSTSYCNTLVVITVIIIKYDDGSSVDADAVDDTGDTGR